MTTANVPASTSLVAFLGTHRHLIASLVRRDLAGRFSGSSLGVLWAVLLPLLQAGVYTFVFSIIMRAQTEGEYQAFPFPVWLLAGLLPWTMLAEALGSATKSLTGNANMVKKTIFDKRVLPLSRVLASLAGHGVSLCVLLLIMLAFGIAPRWTLLLLPFFAALLTLFALAWAYILSALNVFLRDMDHILTVVLQLIFFATPIVYSASFVPEPLRLFVQLNPVHHIVTFYRQILLLGAAPDPLPVLLVSVAVVLFYLLGDYLFRTLSPEFADLL
jgi:ABC-type polysaccharide/polyol phosphate export permease